MTFDVYEVADNRYYVIPRHQYVRTIEASCEEAALIKVSAEINAKLKAQDEER